MNYAHISQQNSFKTKIVLAIYFAIYLFIGLLIDVIILNQPSLTHSLELLITLQVTPYATIILFGIGAVSLMVAITSFARIQLSGEEYIEITEQNTSHGSPYAKYREFYNIMEGLKISANMQYMPKLYVINANYMNAFASGWTPNNTLVAITSSLWDKLNRQEREAVLAHELTHIKNADIKLTLIVGVASNIMLFVLNWIVYIFLRGSRSGGAQKARMILLILQLILPIVTVILQMWMSRSREYMADAGAVELIRDPRAMASALRKISNDYDANDYSQEDDNPTRKEAYIFQKGDSIFSTHPSIKNRLKKLENW